MLNPIDITVASGTSLIVIIPEIALDNGDVRTLKFCLTKAEKAKLKTAVGTEQVLIQNGVGGTSYPLLTRLANLFYADRLRLCYEYRIAFGNNGLPSATQHFINFNTPKCSWGVDPANATAETTPVA